MWCNALILKFIYRADANYIKLDYTLMSRESPQTTCIHSQVQHNTDAFQINNSLSDSLKKYNTCRRIQYFLTSHICRHPALNLSLSILKPRTQSPWKRWYALNMPWSIIRGQSTVPPLQSREYYQSEWIVNMETSSRWPFEVSGVRVCVVFHISVGWWFRC